MLASTGPAVRRTRSRSTRPAAARFGMSLAKPSKELRELEAAILHQDERLALRPEPFPDEPQPPAGRHRRRGAAIVAGGATALVAATALLVLTRDEGSSVAVPPNSVAVIDAKTNRVVDTVPVGVRPGPLAAGLGSVWVGNIDDESLSRIDLKTRRVVKTISLEATPTATAVGLGAVWVVHGLLDELPASIRSSTRRARAR